MKVREIVNITGGRLMSGDVEKNIDLSRISTDSRSIRRGDFFLALKGPNFDGNKFVGDVFRKGAIGAIVSGYDPSERDLKKVIIEVDDTLKALQDIAHSHRMKFKIPVIGVTGSSGKTTVKEMIAHILSAKLNVLKNEGTKNNHIGVPQTLLKLDRDHEICVLELGTNHKGEISLLSRIARPDAAVITNIGPSHLEFLIDLEGVFEAKKEIFDYMNKGSLVFLNGDDEFLSRIRNDRFAVRSFGFGRPNDYRAAQVSTDKKRIKFLLNDVEPFELRMLGSHNIYNALAAISVASHFGLHAKTIRKALAGYRPSGMRLNLKKVRGIDIINDSYNSNPLSMKLAIEALKSYPARSKWVVAGDMLELGKSAEDFHRTIGAFVAKSGVSGLFTFGTLSKHISDEAMACGMDSKSATHCESHDEIVDRLARVAKPGDAILVKGSRGMKMEKVVEILGSRVKGQGARKEERVRI